ncbi:MAG: hypothetical protein JKX98_08940 [Alcanivoracaceae bacterium]|nr:hypothetical protein [Alcanivoracaceae bacterium]
MKNYHPSHAPSSEEWLKLDESLRIDLVKKFDNAAGIEFEKGAENIHSVIHVVTEDTSFYHVMKRFVRRAALRS